MGYDKLPGLLILLISISSIAKFSSGSIVAVNNPEEPTKVHTVYLYENHNEKISQLTAKVDRLEKEFEEYKLETNYKIRELDQARFKVVSAFNQPNAVNNAENVEQAETFNVNSSDSLIKKHRFPTASWAFLYDEPGDHIPLFVFNENREDNVGCLTLRNTLVDEIDTHGTCVILYTEQACTGRSKRFQTVGRQPVEDYNWSIEPCSASQVAPPKKDATPKFNTQIPLAFLYSKFDSISASLLFNQLRRAEASCLTYEEERVNAINTFGTCVYMYTGRDCTGHRTEIQTSHRMKVPSEFEDNNLSVGTCYARADLHDKVHLEGTPVQVFDSRKDGSCLTVDVKVKSMQTHDTCVKIYPSLDCKGKSHLVKPGTSNHWEIPKNFDEVIRSIGPCYS